MKPLLTLLVVASTLLSNAQSNEISVAEDIQSQLKSIYKKADLLFLECSEGFKQSREQSYSELEFEIIPQSFEPTKYFIYGDLSVQVWAQNLDFHSAYNYKLAKKLGGASPLPKLLPTLSSEDAVLRAKEYLRKFEIQIPDNTELTVKDFNSRYTYCWEIRWTRNIQSYPWDDFNPNELESVQVIFHEENGLIGIGNNIFSPLPKSMVVKISRKEAEKRALQYVPLVQRSPYYKQARRDGFVAGEVKSCEVKVSVPNWLLDPDRAIWIRDAPPEETRLCWVVRFSTIDSRATERDAQTNEGKPLKLIPPDVLIYLDATTGECVGANFT